MLEGHVIKKEEVKNGMKIYRSTWIGGKTIKAAAYDSQSAGYNTFNTVSVRLWNALPIFTSDSSKDQTEILK